MKRNWKWLFYLNKRLLYKKEFVILLCIIPLLVGGLSMVSRNDSGIMTVLLCAEDETDTFVGQMIESLATQDSVIRYVRTRVDTAYELIEAGEADCAWIFREDFLGKLRKATGKLRGETPPILVVAQEDTVALELSRMKLFEELYPHLSYLLCEEQLGNVLEDGQKLSEEELRAAFEISAVNDCLVAIVYESPQSVVKKKQPKQDSTGMDETEYAVSTVRNNRNYLMSPLRGLLMILLLVAGLMAALFYLQDEEGAVLLRIPIRDRRKLLYFYMLPAIADTAVVVGLSLFIAEKSFLSLWEGAAFLLYLPLAAVFCDLMTLLCKTKERLSACIPLLVLAMLVLSPVFLDLGTDFVFSYLLPPTYFLRAGNEAGMLPRMLAYTGLLFAVGTLGTRKRGKMTKKQG